MNWLLETLTEPSMIQAVAVISIVAAVGVYLGRLKIFGISLGITFVFFAGIMAGHLGITVNKDMLNFAQNFGLIVFVYTLGLQACTKCGNKNKDKKKKFFILYNICDCVLR